MIGRLAASPFAAAFRQRYRRLQRREQRLLMVLTLLLAAVTLVYGILGPLDRAVTGAELRYQRVKGEKSWMKANELAARSLASAPKAAGGASLVARISEAAQKQGLSPRRIEPVGEEGVSVLMENVSFNSVLRWIDGLSRNGIAVARITITRQPATLGHVTADIEFGMR